MITRILGSGRAWPLSGCEATRRLEHAALRALPAHMLMQRAGAAVARLALALAPHARRIGIVAGSGNNGGDGIEAARWLHLAGKPVDLLLCGDESHAPPDAAAALAAARAAGVPMRRPEGGRALFDGSCDLIIDALLGIGTRGVVSATVASRIAEINAHPAPRLAIDVPSGLDADSGVPLGDTCVRAEHTLALLSLKPGLFTAAGRGAAGEIWLDALGTDELGLAAAADAGLLGPPAGAMAPRHHASHKGTFGDVGVVGGAAGMAGAALLAARAALAAGAGRVFVDLLGEPTLALDLRRPELMLRPGFSRQPGAGLEAMTLVVGCGGGQAVRDTLASVLEQTARAVIDADALNAIAVDRSLEALLRARAAKGQASVITPHPLEAARLLGCAASAIQGDRLGAASRLAARLQCVVVLKGSGTVICAPGGRPRINPTGNASLATAGTGDVLAGWLGGLWSGFGRNPDDVHANAGAAAEWAVWTHGAAAQDAGLAVLRADDLVERLAAR